MAIKYCFLKVTGEKKAHIPACCCFVAEHSKISLLKEVSIILQSPENLPNNLFTKVCIHWPFQAIKGQSVQKSKMYKFLSWFRWSFWWKPKPKWLSWTSCWVAVWSNSRKIRFNEQRGCTDGKNLFQFWYLLLFEFVQQYGSIQWKFQSSLF